MRCFWEMDASNGKGLSLGERVVLMVSYQQSWQSAYDLILGI